MISFEKTRYLYKIHVLYVQLLTELEKIQNRHLGSIMKYTNLAFVFIIFKILQCNTEITLQSSVFYI